MPFWRETTGELLKRWYILLYDRYCCCITLYIFLKYRILIGSTSVKISPSNRTVFLTINNFSYFFVSGESTAHVLLLFASVTWVTIRTAICLFASDGKYVFHTQVSSQILCVFEAKFVACIRGNVKSHRCEHRWHMKAILTAPFSIETKDCCNNKEIEISFFKITFDVHYTFRSQKSDCKGRTILRIVSYVV